ncbi:hypothetical protein SSS_06097 [Sarcoptes scabiei]|nr:hypothetical protein SSS_06097 [Sarcoptes scabiei]
MKLIAIVLFMILIGSNVSNGNVSEKNPSETLQNECDENNEGPILQLNDGQVRGYCKFSGYKDEKVLIYEGIRYGQAPIGHQRFKIAKPVLPWTGIYNATHYRAACFRSPHLYPDGQIPETSYMSEDCLFLTVYRPSRKSSQKRAVMVWIHGGNFESGSIFSLAYDGSIISVFGDVIVVGINYRLGAFGFLYGGSSDAPGNLGLHDQILALQWVQKNIEHFGGDPNSVTIFGESAGSMSVGNLVLSPLSDGLFIRAILQSGAPNSYLGSESKAHSLMKTRKLASKFKCDYSNLHYLVECLRKVPASAIALATEYDRTSGTIFQPIFGDRLMPSNPVETMREGRFNKDIDLLFGVVHDEGSIFMQAYFPAIFSPYLQHPRLSRAEVSVIIHMIFLVLQDPNPQEIADFYLQNIEDDDSDGLSR